MRNRAEQNVMYDAYFLCLLYVRVVEREEEVGESKYVRCITKNWDERMVSDLFLKS